MSEKSTVTVGPWPDRSDEGSPPELVSMTISTFEQLIDELGSQSEDNARLRATIALRPVVSLATGVLMSRYAIEEREALDLLVRWSDQSKVGLRDFATAVLENAVNDPESSEESLLPRPT